MASMYRQCPRNAFPGRFTSSAPAVSPALGCPCSQMQCIHSWVCSHRSSRKPCLGGGPLGWGRGWNRRCPCPVTRGQGPASFPGEDTCWDVAWHSRRPFLLLFFLQPLLPEPPGKRKRGKERQEMPQKAARRPRLQREAGRYHETGEEMKTFFKTRTRALSFPHSPQPP